MNDERITQGFMLSEFLQSDTATRLGIDNTPKPTELQNVRAILAPGMQRVRDLLFRAVFITSGYRSPDLNRAVRGAASSAHLHGLAADFKCPGYGPPIVIARYLVQHATEIGYEQLIQEGDWVHVAFPAPGDAPSYGVLTAHFAGGGVTYTEGLA